MNPISLTERHALVTGASAGIGRAIAEALTRAGVPVTLLSRNKDKLEATCAELRAQSSAAVHAVAADVTKPETLAKAFEEARQSAGPITILVNNAGGAESAPFKRTDAALWKRTMTLNVDSVFHASQLALGDMQAAGWGRIINVASTAGLTGYRYVTAYCAAKHAVVGLTRSLAMELAKTAITVNALCPGYTDTPMLRESLRRIQAKTGCSAEEAEAQLLASNPQGRFIQAEEVAEHALWLCRDGAASITGQSIAIAGGELMP